MRTIFPFFIIALLATGCQKELPLPEKNPVYVRVPSDTFSIRAFYGQQRLSPPSVGTVIFPMDNYNVPDANKLALMSAYTGRNGYGDSAGTVKKNALNDYNGEFYNTDVDAAPNARITIIPIGRPQPEFNEVSSDSSFVFTKFFKNSRQVAIAILLVNGAWERKDTSATGKITIYQMNPLLLSATESMEVGLATQNGVQKIANGQAEFYMAFVNQHSRIRKVPTIPGEPSLVWYPQMHTK